jgi:hypothetical protein
MSQSRAHLLCRENVGFDVRNALEMERHLIKYLDDPNLITRI